MVVDGHNIDMFIVIVTFDVHVGSYVAHIVTRRRGSLANFAFVVPAQRHADHYNVH